MTTVHDPQTFVCGDTWEILGTCTDANGNPLSLSGASITWKLDDPSGLANFEALTVGAGISVISASAGTILITVPASATATLAPGTYADWLRVTLGDGTVTTQWTGLITATLNPR